MCPGLANVQGFAEKLFKRLQGGHERFETRLAMLNVVSRAVGVHKLLLLNFYPFLQASRGALSARGAGCTGPAGWQAGRRVHHVLPAVPAYEAHVRLHG